MRGESYDATYYRPACPQRIEEIRKDIPSFPKKNISEDCLYMNIFAPNVSFDTSFKFFKMLKNCRAEDQWFNLIPVRTHFHRCLFYTKRE